MEASSRSQTDGQLRDYVSIEIISPLASSIKEKMENVCFTPCICRVTDTTVKDHEDKYFPKLVSVGPLHHGKDTLKAMEDQKRRYVYTLLNRKPNLEESLDSCVKAIRGLEETARTCYREKIDMSSDEFVEMMLVDGCFIIELFLRHSVKGLKRRDDPLFITTETFSDLRCDLIMLENQIPFFILQQLFYIVPIPKQCHKSLPELALKFFRKLIPGDAILQEKFNQDFNHLLDLIRHCYLPTYPEVQHSSEELQILEDAKTLKKTGISFERATTQSLLDIKFVDGVLRIPPFRFHAFTEIILRNILEQEQCQSDFKKHVTSYAFFMKQLLQHERDVRLLYRTRILPNGLEKREELLHLMSQLEPMVDVKDYCYNGLCKQVRDYGSDKWLHAWWKKMKHRSRNSPWAFAGLLFAIVFLVLAFAGTLVSVLSFLLHH